MQMHIDADARAGGGSRGSEGTMIVLVAKYYVKDGQVEDVIDALKEMAPLVAQHEPECSLYFANRSTENPNLILLYERYENMAAIDAHRETPHFKEIIEGRIVPQLEKREREFYETVVG
jgi:(4S)-4-hydroxy-5-phosphonooxypentane-2,3-dione isomerase